MVDKFLIGCCYYPEHWNEADMPSDLVRIKSLGFNCIRMGEFSWSMYEREEGKYDFSLLKRAVAEAERLGIFVILGTPTAAPPKWLTEKYPEVLAVDSRGNALQHGSRQHHNHTSEIYLSYCRAITEAMVKEFSHFSNVIGWQIDNEFNCHRNESYSEADDQAFRRWLADKYKDVETLNAAWGNRFWSLEFNDFSQIICPRMATTHPNPAYVTDYYLFLSDTVVNYAAVQVKVIREYMPHAFITHNGWFGNVDYRRLTKECLDFLSYDSYPAFAEKNAKNDGRSWSYKLALTRGCSDRYMVMEQQSGPGGQLSYLLPTPRPGQIRLWTYQDVAHGAVGVLYFRYRTALYGAEQLWYGIYDHDGEENFRSREVRQISEELSRVGGLFLDNRIKPQVAIYADYRNTSVDRVENFASSDQREIFTGLNKRNIHADFIDSDSDFEKYKVIILPHITVADEALAEKLQSFADNGGVVIISARSGVKNANMQYRPEKAPGVFRSLAGCRVDWFTAATNYEKQTAVIDGKEYSVNQYYEMLAPESGESVGEYTADFCKGKPCAVRNGNVYYFGFYSPDFAELCGDIIGRHIAREPIRDPDLEEIPMGELRMCLNHSDREIKLSGYDLLKEEGFSVIPPYGVVLLKNEND